MWFQLTFGESLCLKFEDVLRRLWFLVLSVVMVLSWFRQLKLYDLREATLICVKQYQSIVIKFIQPLTSHKPFPLFYIHFALLSCEDMVWSNF